MTTTPPTTDTLVQTVEEIENDLITDFGVKDLQAFLMTIPVLNWPVISNIVGWFVSNQLGGWISSFIDKLSAQGLVNLQVSGQDSAVDGNISTLQQAQATGDPNAEAQARQALENSFDNLVHSDGVDPTQ
jgi:hypothetical protein